MSEMKDFVIEDGVLIEYKGQDDNIIIPDGVTVIGSGAFKNRAIKGITIPESVITIEDIAFIGCVKEQVLPIYDKYVLKRPGLTGLIGVTMTVRQDGGIDSVLIDTSSVNYPEHEKEVQEKLGQVFHSLFPGNHLTVSLVNIPSLGFWNKKYE